MAQSVRPIGRIAVGSLVALLTILIAGSAAIPRLAGWEPRAVTTQSMKAAGMPAGALIYIEKVDPRDIRIGDVVTYQLASGRQAVVTHRVVGLSTSTDGAERWQMKGDSNPKPDPADIREEQVIGRLVTVDLPLLGKKPLVVQNGGWVAVMSPVQTIIILVTLFLILWVIPDLVSKVRARRAARSDSLRDAPEPERSI